MKNNALSVANYLVDLSITEGSPLTQLGLMKRVYIAHGFSLALKDEPLVDQRFDEIQAWKYGPVIPSVYHSFKCFKKDPIKNKTVVMEWNESANDIIFVEPILSDEIAKSIVKMVYDRYKGYSDREMVDLTHKEGTPWALCYKEGMNNEIPDSYTKLYYTKFVNTILEYSK